MQRPYCGERGPLHLPFQPAEIGDTVGLTATVLHSLARAEPTLDTDVMRERADRIVTSIRFLAGATGDGFVGHMDAYVRSGEYGVRVRFDRAGPSDPDMEL